MGNEKGIMYVAMGEDFVKEAKISAQSAKRVMPEIPITLITDIKVDHECFDEVIRHQEPRKDGGDRVFLAEKTPYEKTLFVDTDIYFEESVYEIFDVLDKFGIAASINQRKYSTKRTDMDDIVEIPESFPEYNGGVIAFNQSKETEECLSLWKEKFSEMEEEGFKHNQAALRYALYQSDVRICTLRSEYNCVFRRPGCVNGKVKLFHGRLTELESYGADKGPDIKQAIEEINKTENLRVYYRIGEKVKIAKPSLLKSFINSIKYAGIRKTFYRGIKFIKN